MQRLPMTVITVMLAAICCGDGWSEESVPGERSAEQAARELLDVTGAGTLGLQVMDQMIMAQKKAMPQIPDQFWADFRSEIQPGTLVDLVVPVYVKHFTVAEMDTLISFYKTPVGQKFITKMPAIMEESMQIGQQWGAELGRKIAARLKEAGYSP